MSTLIWPQDALGQETHLLQRLRDGDLAVVAEVYDRHQRDLCSFASRLLGDRQSAEDLVHDVFMVLPDAIRRFEPGTSLRAFLLGITANRARHHLRSAMRRRRMAERLAHEPTPIGDDPEQHAHRKLLAQTLALILDKLPLDQRVAFVLCDVEGHTSPDAAEILDVPEGTVRTRLFYARQKVRAHLAKEKLR
jgi:RNA polymerase sigma-70 factor (ECF subfamily)